MGAPLLEVQAPRELVTASEVNPIAARRNCVRATERGKEAKPLHLGKNLRHRMSSYMGSVRKGNARQTDPHQELSDQH